MKINRNLIKLAYLVARHVVTGHDHKVKKAVGRLDPGGLQTIGEAII